MGDGSGGMRKLIVAVLIVLFFSYKRAALMDLLTPVFLVSASIMFVLVNVTGVCGEQNSVMRQQQINLHLAGPDNFHVKVNSRQRARYRNGSL